ncbi:multicopper oxidase family protein [Roseovarius sp. CAU 1744]|uniref:multicopper oxidase family protein n=1 Tax=Roseovarius sp. CAU 1744 TaxID=3140368 RepID=UPI00325AC251
MQIRRRGFLAGMATLPMLQSAGVAQAGEGVALSAAETLLQIAPPDYPRTQVWAYNGAVPGTPLRYRQGGTLNVRLVNRLEQGTTVHWHGLRLPNAMDGVPGMTQPLVAPGAAFEYRFRLGDAGTYWYHPHANSLEQVSRGLAGVLVVDEADPPDVDGDATLVLDDWRMTQEAVIDPSFDNRHDMSHAGRLGNYITVNGLPELTGSLQRGTRHRLRLVNTATARVFRLRFDGLRAWVVALDGMPLVAPQESVEIVIAPAQRVDLLVDVTAEAGGEALIASVEREAAYAMAIYDVAGPGGAFRDGPRPLPPNDMPAIDLTAARRVPLVMEGGAMRGLPGGASWEGTRMDMRQLAELGQFWAFNGVAGMPTEPMIQAALGESIRVPISNRTAFHHAMHLHGTHFREVLAEGGLGPWRDTLLIDPGTTREVAFVAENPGDWMFHCHMPAHQMSGMMNWIRVT